ncbi:MAG: M48 family metallopeptidase [Flavobacteriales bacterium]|nr:M48 family metallopeptidase [Flavobacteriales bacterium]
MGRTSIWVDLLKLLVSFALLWLGYTYISPMIPTGWLPNGSWDPDAITLSIEQEEDLGEFLMEIFEIQQSEKVSPKVDSALWVIENRLLTNLGPTDYEYKFMIIDDPMVNAMTLPGGNIIVYTGLLAVSDTPEEVAAVLAHEIGHAEQRHVVDKIVAELGITFVMAVLTGGDPGLVREITQAVVSNVFSRSQEQEADQFGLDLLERSHIDPHALAAFFRKLNRENLSYDAEMEWLMSHPHNNSRIKASLAYKVEEGFQAEPIAIDWEALKSSL